MKKTLEGLVRPQVEEATTAGDIDLRMPTFEKVVTKVERKKPTKELKARDKDGGGGGGSGSKKTSGNDGKKKTGKKLWYCIN